MLCPFGRAVSRVYSIALPWAAHDVNGQNPALVSRQNIIDEVADDGIRFVAELGHHPANQGAAAAVPFQIDCAVHISRAVDLGPSMRPARLFRPDLNETEFLLELRIAHDLAAQRAPTRRDHLDHRLHL